MQVEKRGRFITNMGFANVVTAAVDSDDPRIKGSCMVILEETDPGIWDRGTPTKKLVHQLSSTRDPVFNLKVPASRIIGGYTVEGRGDHPALLTTAKSSKPFPSHARHVGLMTSAKLLSAVEPVILYQRGRFRGGRRRPGTPRYELGLQQKEDACTVWSMSGPRAKPARRWALQRRACLTNSTRWKNKRTRCSRSRSIAAARQP